MRASTLGLQHLDESGSYNLDLCLLGESEGYNLVLPLPSYCIIIYQKEKT